MLPSNKGAVGFQIKALGHKKKLHANKSSQRRKAGVVKKGEERLR